MTHHDFKNELLTVATNFAQLAEMAPTIEKIALRCLHALERGNKLMFCGNGGSAADSQHLAAELVGRYKLERQALPAIALTVDTSILTALGNDYGYVSVFERQIEGLGKPGDVLIGISTSGNSDNVVRAFQKARTMGISTVALTGQTRSRMAELADDTLNVPSTVTNHIQEMHIAVGHLICEFIEIRLFNQQHNA